MLCTICITASDDSNTEVLVIAVQNLSAIKEQLLIKTRHWSLAVVIKEKYSDIAVNQSYDINMICDKLYN